MSRDRSNVELNIEAKDKSRQAFESAQRRLRDTNRELDKTRKKAEGTTGAFNKLGGAISGSVKSVLLLGGAFATFQKSVEQIEIIKNQLEFAGIAASVSTEEIDKFGIAIGDLSGGRQLAKMFLNAKQNLKQFEGEFIKITTLFDNMQKTTGFQASLNIQRLGRITNGSESALTRIQSRLDLFNSTEFKAIKEMQKFGANAEVARRVVDAMQERFGEVNVEDIGVPFRQFTSQLQKTGEELGRVVTIVINPLIGMLTTVLSGLGSVFNSVGDGFDKLTSIVGSLIDKVNNLLPDFAKVDIPPQTQRAVRDRISKNKNLKFVDVAELEVNQDLLDGYTKTLDTYDSKIKNIEESFLKGTDRVIAKGNSRIRDLVAAANTNLEIESNRILAAGKLVTLPNKEEKLIAFSGEEIAAEREALARRQAQMNDLVTMTTDALSEVSDERRREAEVIIKINEETSSKISAISDKAVADEKDRLQKISDLKAEMSAISDKAVADEKDRLEKISILEAKTLDDSLVLFEKDMEDKDALRNSLEDSVTEAKIKTAPTLNNSEVAAAKKVAILTDQLTLNMAQRKLAIAKATTDAEKSEIQKRFDFERDKIETIAQLNVEQLKARLMHDKSLTESNRNQIRNSLDLFTEAADEKLQIAANERSVRIAEGATFEAWALSSAATLSTMARSIGDGITESLGSSISEAFFTGAKGADLFKQSMIGLAQSVVAQLITITAQKVIASVTSNALTVKDTLVANTALATNTTAILASNALVASSSGPAGSLLALATGGVSAGTAAAAYKVALGSMTALNSGVQLASVAGVAHGGLTNVAKESTFLLDKGERVLSPRQNEDLTRFIAEGQPEPAGGSAVTVNFSVSAVDSTGIKQLLARNIPFIAGQIQQASSQRQRRNG